MGGDVDMERTCDASLLLFSLSHWGTWRLISNKVDNKAACVSSTEWWWEDRRGAWIKMSFRWLSRKPVIGIDNSSHLEVRLFRKVISRLRDVTPSHITSLDVTPSEVRTLEVLTFGHWTFGKLHLWAVSPSEYYTFGTLHFRDITPSGHYNFRTFHLQDITASQNYTFHRFWRRPKLKSPKV